MTNNDGLVPRIDGDIVSVSPLREADLSDPPPPLSISSTLALRGVFEALSGSVDGFARLDIGFAPTSVLLDQIRGGAARDVAILTAEAVQRLEDDGTFLRGSRRDLVHSPIGLAVRVGSPRPLIRTLDDLVRTLRAARSIVYSRAGASGIFFAGLIERLGLASELEGTLTVIPSGFTAEVVARGEAEMAIQQVSELLVVPGVEIVGPLPDGAQQVSTFSSAIFASSRRRREAEAICTRLLDPALSPIYAAAGLVQLPSA